MSGDAPATRAARQPQRRVVSLVLGGSCVGGEMPMFRRFGAGATSLQGGQQILSQEEPDAVALLEDVLRGGEGLELRLRSAVAGAGKRSRPDRTSSS